MVITAWQMYWITRLDSINALVVVSAFLFFTVFGGSLATILAGAYDSSKFRFVTATSLILAILLGVSAAFIPSTKDAAAIMVIPKIANNQDVQDFVKTAPQLLNVKMQEWLSDSLKEQK